MNSYKHLYNLMNFSITENAIQLGAIKIPTESIINLIFKIIGIIITIILMYLVIKLGNYLIDKTVKRQKQMRFALDERKALTLGAILSSMLRYLVYFFGIVAILNQVIPNNISITFAGIGGVAIGFGAQSLVKDVINGFFILFENQYNVGDYINIDSRSGIVESLELRVTKLRDFNGDLHIIPNGRINEITNHSRGDMRVLVDIDITYEEDVDKVIDIMQKTCNEFKAKNENIVEGPTVLGMVNLKESGVTIRVVGKAKSMTQWECERALRKELKSSLNEANIEVPYPKRKIIN